MAITHNGTSSFSVITYSPDMSLAVNESGPYNGQQPLSSGLFVISADGNWTFASA
jgi:hypothetical protein